MIFGKKKEPVFCLECTHYIDGEKWYMRKCGFEPCTRMVLSHRSQREVTFYKDAASKNEYNRCKDYQEKGK